MLLLSFTLPNSPIGSTSKDMYTQKKRKERKKEIQVGEWAEGRREKNLVGKLQWQIDPATDQVVDGQSKVDEKQRLYQ